MTGNVNLRDFTGFHTNFLISDFKNLVISLISNKISAGAYEIWQEGRKVQSKLRKLLMISVHHVTIDT